MATLYSDLLLDPATGDLDVSQGLQLIESNQVSLRQRLWLRFNVWTGNWYFDETFGFPYRTYLSKKVMKTVLDNKIKEIARLEPDVLSISDFHSEMNRETRSYQAFFEITTKEQEIVRIAFVGMNDYYYPVPGEGASILCNDDGWMLWANKLYYLVNFRLPKTGDATWWNTWAGDIAPPDYAITTQDNGTVVTQTGAPIIIDN